MTRTPDTSPERLAEIRARHEQYARGQRVVEGFEAVDDLLAMLRERPLPEGHLVVSDQELATLLICAVRYSLGRRTYMPDVVADLVRAYGEQVRPETLRIIARDIDEQERWGYGAPCDEETWRSLRAWLEERKGVDE